MHAVLPGSITFRMEGASTTSSATSSVDGGGRNTNTVASDSNNFRGMFASTDTGGSLLTGAGFSTPLGNGGFEGTSTAGLASGTSFDLNDFPSLGGGGSSNSNNGSTNSMGIAAALREQQQILAHQQQQQQQQSQQQQQQQPPKQQSQAGQMLQGNPGGGSGSGSNLYMLAMTGSNGSNFNMTSEDFPALGGGAQNAGGMVGLNGTSTLNVSSLLGTAHQQGQQPIPSSVMENGLYNTTTGAINNSNAPSSSGLESGGASQLDGTTSLLGGAGLGGLSGLRTSSAPAAPPGPAGVAGNALGGDFGLLGLLGVIRMTDMDRNALALGSDLQLLGLNLGSSDQIFGAFASPWSDSSNVNGPKEPHYQLPSCYYMQPPVLKTGHLSKFQLETLFYIFYALPKDVLQAYAAQELYAREWRYHREHKLWFKRAGPSDGVTAAQQQQQQYLYFDISSWERRLFNGNMNQNIANGFLSEDEVRVKFPNS